MPSSIVKSTVIVRPQWLTTIQRPIDMVAISIAEAAEPADDVAAIDASYLSPPVQKRMRFNYDRRVHPNAPMRLEYIAHPV